MGSASINLPKTPGQSQCQGRNVQKFKGRGEIHHHLCGWQMGVAGVGRWDQINTAVVNQLGVFPMGEFMCVVNHTTSKEQQ